MAYAQYTKCCAPADYSGPFIGSAAFWAGTIISGVILLFGNPGAGILGLILTGIAYCRWWLYGRLVCLGGNRCLIGLPLGVYTQRNQMGLGKFDTDFGINLLLPPSKLNETIEHVAANNTVQGFLLRDQSTLDFPVNPEQPQLAAMMQNYDKLGFTGEAEPVEDLLKQSLLSKEQVKALDLNNDFPGWQAGNFYLTGSTIIDSNKMLQTAIVQGGSGISEPKWAMQVGGITDDGLTKWRCTGGLPVGTIEVEFEGAGVWDLYNALLAATPVAAAAAVVCGTSFFGKLACLILMLIALAIVALGAGIALTDTATPDQADPAIGTIRPGKDVLFVMGTWIYDSAHTGWNELHPVLHCQRIGCINPPDLGTGDPWKTPVDAILSGRCIPDGSAVVRLDGNQFNLLKPGNTINIGGNGFTIDLINDPNTITLTTSAGVTPDPTPWNATASVSLDDPMLVGAVVQVFCGLATDANSPGTIAAQSNPENRWTIHPVVDGCTPRETPMMIA